MACLDEPLLSLSARIAATIMFKYVGLVDFGLEARGTLVTVGFVVISEDIL